MSLLPIALGALSQCNNKAPEASSSGSGVTLEAVFRWSGFVLGAVLLMYFGFWLLRRTSEWLRWGRMERRVWSGVAVLALLTATIGLVAPYSDPFAPSGAFSWRWWVQRVEKNAWQRLGSDRLFLLSIAQANNGTNLVAVGMAAPRGTLPSNSVGVVLSSSDGGANWVPRLFPETVSLNSIAAGEGGYFAAVGHGLFVTESHDFGLSWTNHLIRFQAQPTSPASVPDARLDLRTVAVGADNRVMALGTSGMLAWKESNQWQARSIQVGNQALTPGAGNVDRMFAWAEMPFTKIVATTNKGFMGVGLPETTNAFALFLAEKATAPVNVQFQYAYAVLPVELYVGDSWVLSADHHVGVYRTEVAKDFTGYTMMSDGHLKQFKDSAEFASVRTNQTGRTASELSVFSLANSYAIVGPGQSISFHYYSGIPGGSALNSARNMAHRVTWAEWEDHVSVGIDTWLSAWGNQIQESRGNLFNGMGASTAPKWIPYQALPSPLFWLLSGLTVSGACFARFRLAPERIRKLRVARHAMSDQPITSTSEDKLGFRSLAESLAGFLAKPETLTPFTIAVTGAWGTGKSSVLGMIRQQLETQGYPTVWFNAWHHQHDEQLFASLLQSVTDEGVPQVMRQTQQPFWQRCSSVLRFWFRLWIGRTSALFWVAMLGACLGLVFLLQSRSAPTPLVTHVDGTNKTLTAQLRIQAAGGVTNLSDVLVRGIDVAWVAPETKASKEESKADVDGFEKILGLLDGMVRQVGTLPGTVLGFVGMLVAISRLVSRVRAFGFDPVVVFRQLREGGALPSMEAKNSLQLKFAPKFQEVTSAIGPSKKLVIFIDDLDRCLPDKVVQMLEAINFLVSQGNCHLVLGFDRIQVECAVGLGFDKLAQERALGTRIEGVSNQAELTKMQLEEMARRHRLEFARLYLNKLINLEAEVPKGKEIAMLTDAQEAAAAAKAKIDPVSVVAKAFAKASSIVILLCLLPLGATALAEVRRDGYPQQGPTPAQTNTAGVRPMPSSAKGTQQGVVPGMAGSRTYWYVWWICTPLLVVAGLAVSSLSRPVPELGEDPAELHDALVVWLPWVESCFQSPREKKRFLNLTRFLSLRLEAAKIPAGERHLEVDDIVFFVAREARPEPAAGSADHALWSECLYAHDARFHRTPTPAQETVFLSLSREVRFGDRAPGSARKV